MDTTFAELPLGSKLQAAITAAGYTIPTPIQAQAIPVAVSGRDVLGIAQTGTGKTASFVLPMIQRLEDGRARARMPRSLILAPTRELAAQVAQSFEKYGVNHKLTVALLIGGMSMDEQVKKLDRGVDVLIATPGRLLDHFQRGRIMLMGAEILVIDEADRMLDMGFIPDIEKICKLLPPKRQTLFFSATMPNEIKRLVDTFLKDPVRVEVARPATTAKTITQRFRFCTSTEDYEKREVLRELIHSHPVKNAIIFCNRKRDVAILHKSLIKHGFNAGALHGDMDQKARMETLDKFRNGEILLLAASDVAARGLDIPDVSHIFNFDIPWAGDDYVHRIGRTGRAGKEGTSVSLVTPEDLKLIKDIEKVTGETPTWIGEPPTEADFADGGKRRRGRRTADQGPSKGADRAGSRRDARGGTRTEGKRPARDEPRAADARAGEPLNEARVSSEGRREGRRSRGHERVARVDGAPQQANGGELPAASGPAKAPSRGRDSGRDPARHGGPDTGRGPDTAREPRRTGRRDQPRQGRAVADADLIPGFGDQPTIERPKAEPAPRDRDVREPAAHARSEQAPPNRAQRSEQSGRPARRDGGRERLPERSNDRQSDRQSERPARVEREPRTTKAEPAGGIGFADNVPAFLRRPVRPVKVANE